MTQGSLDGNLITCAWHNWKFRVDDGACVVGEEDITTHRATVDDEGVGAGHAWRSPTSTHCAPGCWPACAGVSNATTSARSAATWFGCCRPTPTRENWSGRRSPMEHPGPSSVGGIRSPPPPTAWRWSICTRVTSGHCRSCRRSPASPRPNATARSTRFPTRSPHLPAEPLAEFRRAVEAEQLEQAQALVRGAIHAGYTAPRPAAVVHGGGQRSPAVVRSRCHLLPEGLRTPRLHRLATRRHGAAAPRADHRVRHPRRRAALHPPIHARPRRRRPGRSGRPCPSTTAGATTAPCWPRCSAATARRSFPPWSPRCEPEPVSTACSTSWSRRSASG